MLDWIRNFLDLLIVSILINKALVFLTGTRGIQLFKGFLVIAFAVFAADMLEFKLISWIFNHIIDNLLLAVIVVFQPEIRTMLEEVGRGKLWERQQVRIEEAQSLAEEICNALIYFRTHKIGALLVFQQATGLKEYWRTAVKLDAAITEELIISTFWKDNPLHDGAIIVDRSKLIAGGCYLPLSDNMELSRWFGTRHRAALGISEVSDALVLVASEERGEISMAFKGHLSRNMKDTQLMRLLTFYFSGTGEEPQRTLLGSAFHTVQTYFKKRKSRKKS
jgi:diadenylate cyclase